MNAGGKHAATTTDRRARWALVALLLLGLALELPTLRVGFFADDYVQRLALEQPDGLVPIPRWNLFDFGDLEGWRAFAAERSPSPWWTGLDWKVRFFRPLASATTLLDGWLWGDFAPGHHLTSLVLFVLFLGLAHALFRRLGFGTGPALLGLAVLACSDASAIPVGWLANRNALLEGLFATAALLVARGGPAGAGRVLAALGLGVAAALSKESGALVFLLLALSWASTGSRRVALASALLAPLWLGGLALAGFGTHSLFYATPWLDPGRFAANLGVLLLAGTLSFIGPFPLDLLTAFPSARPWMLAGGLLVGVPAVVWIVRAALRHPAGALLAAWTVLFLLPQATAPAADRLLFVPMVGFAGMCGLALGGARAPGSWRAVLGRRALLASLTLGSAFVLLAQNANLATIAAHVRDSARATDVGDPALGRRDVIVLQTESQMQGFTLGATWHGETRDDAVRFFLLQIGGRPLRWTRVDDRSFELESLAEPFLTHVFEEVYRTPADRPEEGRVHATPLGTVQTLDVDARGPRRLRVVLERPLDDPHVLFVRPVAGILTRIGPPELGQAIELPQPERTGPFIP